MAMPEGTQISQIGAPAQRDVEIALAAHKADLARYISALPPLSVTQAGAATASIPAPA
jgi:hypothetical protein